MKKAVIFLIFAAGISFAEDVPREPPRDAVLRDIYDAVVIIDRELTPEDAGKLEEALGGDAPETEWEIEGRAQKVLITVKTARKRINDLEMLQINWSDIESALLRMEGIETKIGELEGNIDQMDEVIEHTRNSPGYNSENERIRGRILNMEAGHMSDRAGFDRQLKEKEGALDKEKLELYREYPLLQEMSERGEDLADIDVGEIARERDDFKNEVQRIEKALERLSLKNGETTSRGHQPLSDADSAGETKNGGGEGDQDSYDVDNQGDFEEKEHDIRDNLLNNEDENKPEDSHPQDKGEGDKKSNDRKLLKVEVAEALLLTFLKGGLKVTRADLKKVDEAIEELKKELKKSARPGDLRRFEELKSGREKMIKEIEKMEKFLREKKALDVLDAQLRARDAQIRAQVGAAIEMETHRANREWLEGMGRAGLIRDGGFGGRLGGGGGGSFWNPLEIRIPRQRE